MAANSGAVALLPCPECGGEAYADGAYWVSCSGCDMGSEADWDRSLSAEQVWNQLAGGVVAEHSTPRSPP